MPDQLSLALEPLTPRLPATLRPMLARTALEPFDSPDHLFEPNWGGTRVLAFIERNAEHGRARVRLLDERGRDVAPLLPELERLTERVAADSVVLDGEVVVVDRLGRGDALALASRLRGKPGPAVAFLAFDVLYHDGRPLLNTALDRRRALLRRLLRPGDEALAVPSIAGDGRALFAAVVDSGIAGVMGRLRRSPYLPGVRSRMWQFVARDAAAGAGAGAETDATGAGALATPEQQMDLATEPGAASDAQTRNAPMLALIRRLPLDDSDS
jgi:ATP-dependent DNA ligase